MRLSILLTLLFLFHIAASQDSTVVEEHFINNTRKWKTGKLKGSDALIAEGFYSIQNTSAKPFHTVIPVTIDLDKENFLTESVLSFYKNSGGSELGLIIGMTYDEKNYLYLGLNTKGEYCVKFYTPSVCKVLQHWKKDPSIHAEKSNKLLFRKEYNCGYFYINDILVYSSCDFTNFGHCFGFSAAGKTFFNADYLIIKKWQKNLAFKSLHTPAPLLKKNLGTTVNSPYTEVSPFISYDGKTLFFSRLGDPSNLGGEKDYDIWFSTLNKDGSWTEAKNAGAPINNIAPNALHSISPDNNTILVSNSYNSDGSPGGIGLSYSHYGLSGWEIPKKMNIKNLLNKNEYVDYFLSSDNKVLLCAIDNGKTLGLKDIFVSFIHTANTFSEPVNLGPVINTCGEEFGIYLAADNKTLYFSSYGHENYGSADIFVTKRLDETWKNWSKPQNLGPDINTENWDGAFKISAKGDYAYFSSKCAESVKGSEDLYSIKLPAAIKPEPVLLIKGKVINQKDKQPMGASITYSYLSDNKEVGIANSSPVDGSYQIILPAGKAYSFLAGKQGYYPVAENIKTDSLSSYIEIERDLYLAPVEKGQTILLNNLFFEFDKATLKKESIAELNRLINILQEYPAMHIEISGHTDNLGTDEYNLQLANNRSNSVKNYLLQHGIKANRLSSKGYGETKPVHTNDTAEGSAKNRRVEFTILQLDP